MAQGSFASTCLEFDSSPPPNGAHHANLCACVPSSSGQVKCERYWPLDYTPCVYDDITVSVVTETILPDWTIRDFRMKKVNSNQVDFACCLPKYLTHDGPGPNHSEQENGPTPPPSWCNQTMQLCKCVPPPHSQLPLSDCRMIGLHSLPSPEVSVSGRRKCLIPVCPPQTDEMEVRLARHYHYTSWPDHQVPPLTSTILRFRDLVREHMEQQEGSGPALVHCR